MLFFGLCFYEDTVRLGLFTTHPLQQCPLQESPKLTKHHPNITHFRGPFGRLSL